MLKKEYRFPMTHISLPNGQPAIKALMITCSSCDNKEKIPMNKDGRLPDQKAANLFRNRGWEVANKNYCPACIAKRRKPKPEPENNVVQLKPTTQAPPAAETLDDLRAAIDRAQQLYNDIEIFKRSTLAEGVKQLQAFNLECDARLRALAKTIEIARRREGFWK